MTVDPTMNPEMDDWFLDLDQPSSMPDDMWDWVEQPEEPVEPFLDDQEIFAVLVTRNAHRWLDGTIAALDALSYQPSRIIAIDNGSDDSTPDLLEQAKEAGQVDAVYRGDPEWGFGAAVASALALDPQANSSRDGWLWLLHDDAEPSEDALKHLVARGIADDDVAIVAPMLLQASRRGDAQQISELGTSITATGARELSLEQGEINQGQHDSSSVLGMSTCGILVRRSAWEELGGFDDAIPLFRDGTELGWRANLAGYRVVTAPNATIVHRQVGRAGFRDGVERPTASDRAYGMMTVVAHRRGIGGIFTTCAVVLATLLRACGFLLGKAPGRAADEIRALGMFLRSGAKVRKLRARIHAIATSDDAKARIATLRPRWNAPLAALANLVATEIGDWWADRFGSSLDTSIDDLTGDDFSGQAGQVRRRRPWLLPTTVTFTTLFVLSLLAARNVYGGGHLTSWHLMPAPDKLGALYHSYLDPIAGAPRETAPPWVGLVALCSTLFFGQPEWFIATIFVCAVPLAAWSGYAFLRGITGDRRARLVGAVFYGMLPAVLGAVSRGQLGIVVWAIVLPLLGVAVLNWRRRGTAGFESWRGAFQVALCLAVLASFTPLILIFGVIVGAVVAIRSQRQAQILRIAVALATPTLLLSPWIPTLVAHPGRFFTGDDPVLDGMMPANGPLLFIGRTPGAGLPPVWLSAVIFGVIWLLALAGIVLRARLVRAWIATCLGSFAFAIVLSKLVVVVPPAAGATRPAAGLWLLLAFGALIATAAVGFEEVATSLAERSFGILQGLSLTALVGAVVVGLLGIGWWVVAGITEPMGRTTFQNQPSYVRQAQLQGYDIRSMVVDLGGEEPTWDVKEGDGSRLGDGERGPAFGGKQEPIDMARGVVADIASGRSDEDLAERLAQLGIGYITVRNANSDELAAVNSIPGLTASTGEDNARTWRVTTSPARAMVLTPGERIPVDRHGTILAAGAAGRQLVIAAPADPRFTATIDGRELESVPGDDGDYRQIFTVGDRSGVIAYELKGSTWWAWLQLAGLLVLIVLVFPSLRRTETRDPAQYARRAARMEEDQ